MRQIFGKSRWRCRILALGLVLVAGSVMARERLVFCTEAADVRPWRTQQGTGLNYVLLERVARAVGVRFTYDAMSWTRCLALLRAGAVDGAFAASYKAERVEYGAYPGGATPDAGKRLHLDRYLVLRRKGERATWDGKAFKDVGGRVGIQLGYSVAEQLQQLGVAVDDGAQTPDALVRKVAAGHVAMAAMLEGEAQAILAADAALAARVEILPAPLVEKPYYLMLSHALTQSEPALARSIWQAIETVRRSRDYQREERDALDKR